jgi:hypothetical protein
MKPNGTQSQQLSLLVKVYSLGYRNLQKVTEILKNFKKIPSIAEGKHTFIYYSPYKRTIKH